MNTLLKYIFDCVVSEYFPVNDFTMNDLIYDGTTINDILNTSGQNLEKTYMYHGARYKLNANVSKRFK